LHDASVSVRVSMPNAKKLILFFILIIFES
jgi:hypothetical protein